MRILLFLVASILAGAGLLVLLARRWANTEHGRIEPIFALAFKLGPIFRPESAEGALQAGKMTTPEACARVRAEFTKNVAPLAKPLSFAGGIEERRVAGSPGGELPVRIYRPAAADLGGLPLLVYFHGGGFVVGGPDYTEHVTRQLAQETPAVVVSVDYRLAPEHRFPAAVDDAEFAVNWCFENAEALGARKGPVAVAGDSAGGNLAAVVAQRDRDAGRNRVGLQLLIYPCTDVSRTDRASHRAFGRGYGLSKRDIDECMQAYVPDRADRLRPDCSPLLAQSFAGLPPAYVLTAGFDVLRDEGTAYADALRAAGVRVTYVNEARMPHGFITMSRVTARARATVSALAAELRTLA